MDANQTYYFVATCLASVVGFALAFIVNRFANKLDTRMDKYDRLFETQQEEIAELKKISAVTMTRLEHLEDKVYPVRYEKKR